MTDHTPTQRPTHVITRGELEKIREQLEKITPAGVAVTRHISGRIELFCSPSGAALLLDQLRKAGK